MKKFLAMILAAMLSMTAFGMTAHAEDYSQYVESENSNFEGQTSIDYHAYSTYSVTIPTSISQYDASGTVSVTMDNIESGYHIEVHITNLNESGELTVTSDSGNTGVLAVLYSGGLYTADSTGLIGSFYPADYNYEGSASTDISFDKGTSGALKAGTYHGTVCFRVECVPDTNTN